MMDTVSIFLVCKNDFFFRNIMFLLENRGVILKGICLDPDTALEQFNNSGADIIIMDANWINRGYSGKQILEKLLTKNQHLKVVAVSSTYDNAQVYCLRKSGAKGYFARGSSGIDEITHCIKQVHLGQFCFLME
ncbi:MAG: hypothetical protein QM768_17865 [Agriterribacter sp.]